MATLNHTNLTTYEVPALMDDKHMTPEQGYPGLFHVGFLQPTQDAVDQVHEALNARNYMAPKPARLQRGGPPTYGFYYDAPGGVLVEVSTMNMAEPALPHPEAKQV